jgi:hypothetical protein
MIRMLRVMALVLAAAAAVYIGLTWALTPDRMPMQWDLHNRPTWTASKSAFFGMFAGGLLLGLALTFVRPAAPVGAAIVFSDALLLHVCRQAATGGSFLAIPVGAATIVVLAVSFSAAIVTAMQALKLANSRAGGAPPPAPPRVS